MLTPVTGRSGDGGEHQAPRLHRADKRPSFWAQRPPIHYQATARGLSGRTAEVIRAIRKQSRLEQKKHVATTRAAVADKADRWCKAAAEERGAPSGPRKDGEPARAASNAKVAAMEREAERSSGYGEVRQEAYDKYEEDVKHMYIGNRGMMSSTRTTSEMMRRSKSPVSGRPRVSEVVTTVTVVCGPPMYESAEASGSDDDSIEEDD